MTKKTLSTYERLTQDPARKKKIDEEYLELLSEVLIRKSCQKKTGL